MNLVSYSCSSHRLSGPFNAILISARTLRCTERRPARHRVYEVAKLQACIPVLRETPFQDVGRRVQSEQRRKEAVSQSELREDVRAREQARLSSCPSVSAENGVQPTVLLKRGVTGQ